jgi:predicted TIM-barrel fold metal-dependent hydrolase
MAEAGGTDAAVTESARHAHPCGLVCLEMIAAGPWRLNDRSSQHLASWATQYRGLGSNSPELAPCFAVAEEVDMPVGIHIGMGGPLIKSISRTAASMT